MTRAAAVALLGALGALALAGCEDWDQLACGVRHVCGGDAGAFQLQGGVDDPNPGPLLAFVAGDSSRAVLTSRTLWVLDDAGVGALSAAPSSAWQALGGVGVPTRYFLAGKDGKVRSWAEPRRFDHLDFEVDPGQGWAPGAAAAYLDPGQAPAVAFFGATLINSTSVLGIAADGGVLGTDSQACLLLDLEAGAIVHRSTSLVVGISNACDPLTTSQAKYVATFWPRDSANPPPVALSSQVPSRVRLGSNGDVATVAYEVAGGVAVARVVDAGLQNNLLSVVYSSDAGSPSFRSLLDGVLQLGDPDRFVYALTNRNPRNVGVTPDVAGGATVDVPAGATLLVFGRWPDRDSTEVTATQLLTPARPFTALRFALDPHQAEAWLVAACPPQGDAGYFDTYCPGPQAHLALFRWVP